MTSETFQVVSEVYRQAIRDATGGNPTLAADARAWLDICAPDWRQYVRSEHNVLSVSRASAFDVRRRST
ncbi:MAG: hypothetical protein H6641_15695 [Caldilineaceae bacterium]|nr:hypothetical protein [Caldilineaceae bacterium]